MNAPRDPERGALVAVPSSEEPAPWVRLLPGILTVFAAQVGLLFAFGDRRDPPVRTVENPPEIQLAGVSAAGFLEAQNPTLFAMPNKHGFSAPVWLPLPKVDHRPFEWREETTTWLGLPVEQLGRVLDEFMQTNTFAKVVFNAKPQAALYRPVVANQPGESAYSTLRIEGDLKQRTLLEQPVLPPQSAADILKASTVNVLVDNGGFVISTALLPPGSGSPEADRQALNIAKQARFDPLNASKNSEPEWTTGNLIFHWQTVPTNAPAANPQQ